MFWGQYLEVLEDEEIVWNGNGHILTVSWILQLSRYFPIKIEEQKMTKEKNQFRKLSKFL